MVVRVFSHICQGTGDHGWMNKIICLTEKCLVAVCSGICSYNLDSLGFEFFSRDSFLLWYRWLTFFCKTRQARGICLKTMGKFYDDFFTYSNYVFVVNIGFWRICVMRHKFCLFYDMLSVVEKECKLTPFCFTRTSFQVLDLWLERSLVDQVV